MAIDPLSAATRNAKRNLLVVSMLAITYRAFDINIDKIPFSVITVDFNPGLFAFLLAISLAYFLVAFCLYYYIDIKNVEKTPHEVGFRQASRDAIAAMNQRAWKDMEAAASVQLGEKLRLRPLHDISGNPFYLCHKRPFKDIVRFRLRPIMVQLDRLVPKATGAVWESNVSRDEHEAVIETVERMFARRLWIHWWRFKWKKAQLNRQWFAVASIYPFRNYVFDGAIPIAAAIVAFLALYNLVDLHWVHIIAPSK